MYERWLDRIIGDKLQDILGQNMVMFQGKLSDFPSNLLIFWRKTC